MAASPTNPQAGAGEPLKTPLNAPPVQEMTKMNELSNFLDWNASQVADYFASKGFEQYRNLWTEHAITGDRVVLLDPEDMKVLDIPIIGHRMGIQTIVDELKLEGRKQRRNKQICRHLQAYDGSPVGETLATCCGLMPRDPDVYTLTASSLQLEEFDIPRICGIWKCQCLGKKVHTDNINLDLVRDVDTIHSKLGCCCLKVDKCTVLVAVGAGGQDAESDQSRNVVKELLVEGADGEPLANQIFMVIEEYKASVKNFGKKKKETQ